MAKAEIQRIVNDLLLTKEEFSSGELAAGAGLTRQAVHRHLVGFMAAGQLIRVGAGRGARYRRAGDAPRDRFTAQLKREPGLAEDAVWDEGRAALPRLADFRDASAVMAHAFTEMLNNAIDHSGSPTIDVSLELDVPGDVAAFTIVDRGIGVFENVRAKLALENTREALQEISKGKTTTQPERHSGEGIFFTSKMGRTFELEANGLLWVVDNARDDQMIAGKPLGPGTTVRFETSLSHPTLLEPLYARYTHDFVFDTSRVVVKLFEHGVRFVSRSEAKRLLVGLEKFREVVVDFAGVEGVGQGFADEIFRVWAKQHPATRLSAERMNEAVTFMVERARRAT